MSILRLCLRLCGNEEFCFILEVGILSFRFRRGDLLNCMFGCLIECAVFRLNLNGLREPKIFISQKCSTFSPAKNNT